MHYDPNVDRGPHQEYISACSKRLKKAKRGAASMIHSRGSGPVIAHSLAITTSLYSYSIKYSREVVRQVINVSIVSYDVASELQITSSSARSYTPGHAVRAALATLAATK